MFLNRKTVFTLVKGTITSTLLLCSTHLVAEEKSVTFTQTPLGEEFTCAHDALNMAYDTLGYKVNYLTLPSKRALKEANEGDADGEMLRSDGVEINYPNLIRIPVPICAVESVLIAKEHVHIEQFSDLRNFHMGITTGFVDQERFIATYHIDAARAIRNDVLIEMFLRDRVDVIFLTHNDAQKIIQESKGKNYRIIKGFNRQVYLYHYLHKKHNDLVPLVTKALFDLENKSLIDLRRRAKIKKYENMP